MNRGQTTGSDPDATPRLWLLARNFAAFVATPMLLLGAVQLGADLTYMRFRPSRSLGLPYSQLAANAYWAAPLVCAALWFTTVRKRPLTASLVALVLSFGLIGIAQRYGVSPHAAIRVGRWVEPAEIQDMIARCNCRVFEEGSYRGTFVMVAVANELPARAYLNRLGVLAPARGGSGRALGVRPDFVATTRPPIR